MSARATTKRDHPICYYCKQDLCDEELDFYPCPCRYPICYECYQAGMESKERRCPFCQKYYEGHHHYQYQQSQQQQRYQQQQYNQHHAQQQQQYSSSQYSSTSKSEYFKKGNQTTTTSNSVRQVKNISSTQETYSSSNMSSYSNKHGSQNNNTNNQQHHQISSTKSTSSKQAGTIPSQTKRSTSDKNVSQSVVQQSNNSQNQSQNQLQSQQQQQQNLTNNTNKESYFTQSSNQTQNQSQSQNNSCLQQQLIQHSKLSSIRILQKHILYAIGLSPQIAKEEILRKYEYFGQYGRIVNILINKEKAYQADNQLLCYSAFITYSQPQEASIGILAVDQHQYEGRMIRASYGRTKYCKFFLKDTQCLNKDCPYQHMMCEQSEILTQDDMQKSQIFQQYQALAFQLSQICMLNEDQFKACMKTFRETCLGVVGQNIETVMPTPESIYEKKALFKQYEQYKKQNQHLFKQMTQSATSSSQVSQSSKKEKLSQKSQMYQVKAPQSRNHNGLLSTQSQAFQLKNKTHAQLTTNQNAQFSIGQSIESANLGNQIDNLSLTNQDLKKPKRNNSTDETRNKVINDDNKYESVQTFEQQIAESLRKLIDTQDIKDQHSESNNSKNSQRKSRYMNSSQDGQEGTERAPLRDLKLSRRSSVGQGYQKKGSMKSLIVESLKFLIDDTDVVPNKREPLIVKQETNPPSEVFNVATPAQSHLGGYNDDDYLWNSTIFSQHDFSQQKNMTPLDDKSYYSHQGFNNTYMNSTGKNNVNGSTIANSCFNQNQQQVKVQPFNDSNFWNRSVGQNNYFGNLGPINQNLMQTQSTYYQMGRKTTLANDQISSSNIGNDNKSAQLTRSPSQPNYEKLQLGQMATRNGLNTPYHPSQMSLMYNSQNQFQDLYMQQKRSQCNQTPFSVTDQNSNKQSYKLNQQNLDLLDKYYNDTSTYRDLYHAKIFTQDGTASQNNNIISSQSLFCYNSQLEDEYEVSEFNKRFSKLSERGQLCGVPRTPVKDSRGLFRLTDDEFFQDDSQYDKITKNSEPKNYYKEFLSIKDSSIFSGNLFTKRRNSLEQERDKLQPQSLQFNNILSVFMGDNQTDNGSRNNLMNNNINNNSLPLHNMNRTSGGTFNNTTTISSNYNSAQKPSTTKSKNRKTPTGLLPNTATQQKQEH